MLAAPRYATRHRETRLRASEGEASHLRCLRRTGVRYFHMLLRGAMLSPPAERDAHAPPQRAYVLAEVSRREERYSCAIDTRYLPASQDTPRQPSVALRCALMAGRPLPSRHGCERGLLENEKKTRAMVPRAIFRRYVMADIAYARFSARNYAIPLAATEEPPRPPPVYSLQSSSLLFRLFPVVRVCQFVTRCALAMPCPSSARRRRSPEMRQSAEEGRHAAHVLPRYAPQRDDSI